jgi:L-cysteate sulfo-lyase
MTSSVERLTNRLARFPRLGLAHLPTPLEPMKQLTVYLAKGWSVPAALGEARGLCRHGAGR